MSPTLARRLREHRSRVLIRAWSYRQRRTSRGVWFRLRRLLAATRAAYEISPEDAAALTAEGCRPEPVGGELEPPKALLVVSEERVARLASAREVPVRLGGDLLAAERLALVPFARI